MNSSNFFSEDPPAIHFCRKNFHLTRHKCRVCCKFFLHMKHSFDQLHINSIMCIYCDNGKINFPKTKYRLPKIPIPGEGFKVPLLETIRGKQQ